MEKLLIFLLFFVSLCFCLQYIESSTGLTPPNWEGGRTELEFADINNDGNPDILSIGDHGSPYINATEHGVMVWFGNGQGQWTNYMNGNFGYGGIAIGDVNNDGYLDVGYGMHHNYSSTDFGNQLMEVALGDGTGMNWTPWDDSLGMHGQTWGMFGTDFADVDNDGDLDIGSVSFGASDGIHIYQNMMNGSWRRSFGFIGGNSNMEFYFGDFNKDGKADFAATHQYASVYFGDGNGNFTSAHYNLPSPGSVGYRSIGVGDVDNDGGMDIGFITSAGRIMVYVYDETGDTWRNFSGNLPTSSSFQRINLWDMDADGNIDVIAQGNGLLRIWTGNSQGQWTQATQFNTPTSGTGQALTCRADCDHNGYPDIAMVVTEGSYPSNRNVLRFFKETSTPSNLSIISVFPKGNEKFYARSVNFIKWISAVPNNETSYVSIQFSAQGPNGPWTTLFNPLPNNGTKQWQIPNVNSTNCYLRLKVYTSAESSFVVAGPFTIIGGSTNVTENRTKMSHSKTTCLIQNNYLKIPVITDEPDRVTVSLYSVDGKNLYVTNRIIDKGTQDIIINKRLANGIYYINLQGRKIDLKLKIIKIDN
ncbi:MAG: T9SS type A sorting domain-containing protein [candidate division WOR-3 bacterium]|nr:T9SS type A sorting domain-containing protein [candidate division WOR-3 bacterium]